MKDLLALTLGLLATTSAAPAGENPRAARSVHLAYHTPEAVRYYNEMVIEQSVPGSYFMACGFDRGYFGLQDLGGGRKIALFSVWDDARGDDPGAVSDASRVKVLSQGSNVTVRRFGGEGTGAQCLRGFLWETGRTYRFVVSAWTTASTTTYRGQLFDPAASNWVEMATYRTPTDGTAMRGLHSFVEDFRRDGRSVGECRSARFGPAWTQQRDGTWRPVTRAAFSADGNVHTNIDARAEGHGFRLATGGATSMSRPVWSTMTAPPADAPPVDLPPATAPPP